MFYSTHLKISGFKALSALLLSSLLFVAMPAQSHEAQDSSALAKETKASLAAGDALFQKKCSVCHGSEGDGGVGVPLNFRDFLSTSSNRYLHRTIQKGRPGRIMPAFTGLSETEIRNIIQYIRSWKPEIAVPEYSLAHIQGDIAKGQKVYESICINCHREKGVGGKGTGVTFSRPRDAAIIAPAIGNPAFLSAASDQMLKRIIMTGRESTPMVSAQSMGLKEVDVDNVVTYLRSLAKSEKSIAQKNKEKGQAVLVYESSYSLEETIENMKRAAIGYNFRYIREQTLDQGFVDKEQENKDEYLIYFCNFNFLNQALSVDPRIGMFLPFRDTIIKKDDTVLVMTVNPDYLCSMFNNNELKQGCEFMSEKYEAMLEESTL
ncbi:c-type cytochrome [sulfur-oxidizing endosymbiont of Gigantopelta aegis]|uniref:c-type cytochrome n=1 Tax=sulfur-oxidizing endosymbiont of Gigantopelta aegis TaxID=2794934 RepID=UPI0018DC3651|nr:c-type cytochrome [sulfur-oxidizing endosymbiont of Gigantopelta aegis]